ncbi:protein kinase [Chromatiaceae bacterium AAb-1]|nr:protein kinase [Chromatiaceae bacterium AAb-1]
MSEQQTVIHAGLQLQLGIHSCAGTKPLNQDFAAARVPPEPELTIKGAAFAVADGISSSSVSHVASETAVTSFLEDYFCTSDSASVRQAGCQVLQATNAWLDSQNRQSPYRGNPDKGYVCAFSALVIKGRHAHLFHIGDARIYLLRAGRLQQLTRDHRQAAAGQESYLSRALGAAPDVSIDYQQLLLKTEDILLLLTDGISDVLDEAQLLQLVQQHQADLSYAASMLTAAASAAGSDDNLTAMLVQVQQLAVVTSGMPVLDAQLAVPGELQPDRLFDGYRVIRRLHASHRSHLYLVEDSETRQQMVLKAPATDMAADEAYLQRLMLEDWIARRVNSQHVIRAIPAVRPRHYIYTVAEYIAGQTLRQWLSDHPQPSLSQVRDIIAQVGKGLQALHRAEILHQDLRPENIMIDADGRVKIIDLGSARVAGLAELHGEMNHQGLGTAIYAAPEYFLGEAGTERSDLFSLAVLCYHMLSGRFPYGTRVARCHTLAQQKRLQYLSVCDDHSDIPRWLDETLKKALQMQPEQRYQELSVFLYDLNYPNPAYQQLPYRPLIQRDPLRFWQLVSLVLLFSNLYMLYLLIQ